MGKWKAVIPIVLALVIALGGSLFLHRWLQVKAQPKETVEVAETKAVPVAVAVVSIPWGTKLKRDMIKTVPYLTESLPTGYSSDGNKLEGRVVIAALRQNEPNPFQAGTAVWFDIPAPGSVTLEVVDVEGRLVRLLLHDHMPAGRHSVNWDGCDAAGMEVGPGIYFVRMRAGDFSAARKMMTLR